MLMPRQKTPDLSLPTLDHGQFDLSTDGSERGTVICFYRGLHCPLCANYLTELEKRVDEFAESDVKAFCVETASVSALQHAFLSRWKTTLATTQTELMKCNAL